MLPLTEVFDSVFKSVFLVDGETSINVFLCGKSLREADSIRSRIYKNIAANPRVNVVFPEWVFANLMGKQGYDLLSLENDLAQNVDLIVLPLEGIGTFAELGAFSSREDLRSRLLIVNFERFQDSASFIAKGPIALVKQTQRDRIWTIRDQDDVEKIEQISQRIANAHRRTETNEIANIFNLSRFLLYCIVLLQPVGEEELSQWILEWKPAIPKHYVDPSVECLFEKKFVVLQHGNHLHASETGMQYVAARIRTLRVAWQFNRLRAMLIHDMDKTRRRFDIDRVRAKLLEANH
jgi:hypothetical protein